MEYLVEQVAQMNRKHGLFRPGDRVLVAVSGGVDSVSLFHVLGDPAFGLERVAAYVHHGLRPEADQEAEWVRRLAESQGVPCRVLRRNVRQRAEVRGESIQMAARAERYNALRETAADCGAVRIALGHHANDQAETFILRLLTGTGPEGLGGMAPLHGIFIRPFLHVLRDDILDYAVRHGLEWLEDRSNKDPHYLRNRVRRDVIPLLENIQPRIVPHLVRLSALAGEWRDWLSTELDERAAALDWSVGEGRISWSRPAWLELPLPLKRAVLKRAFYLLHADERLETAHLDRILRMIDESPAGGRMQLPGAGFFVLSAERMIVETKREPPASAQFCVPVRIPGETPYPGGVLVARRIGREELPGDWREVPPDEAYFALKDPDQRFFLRNRRPGDRVRLFGRSRPEKLKKLLIDRKIPREQRERIPLLVDEEGVIWWVVGVRRGNAGRVGPDDALILHLRLERKPDE